MTDILFIKTSSLGDVIHHMPALTEAKAHRPDARFAWVVEEPYAPLARLHPAAGNIITVATRRWRNGLLDGATWREIGEFRGQLAARSYDAVIDTQGLFRTGVIARVARGVRHGFDFGSVREPPAALFYDVRHKVPADMHAIDRNRELVALALGYESDGDPDFGLTRPRIAGDDYAVLLHATARREKEWPEENWIALGKQLGVPLVLLWGDERERERAQRIAAALPNARVPDKMPLGDVAQLIGGAAFVVGVDTGLLHLAAAFGVPLVAIFTGTKPSLTGPLGRGPMQVLGMEGKPPSVSEVAGAVGRVR